MDMLGSCIYAHRLIAIGHLIATDKGYKIVLPPEFKYILGLGLIYIIYILATVLVPGV